MLDLQLPVLSGVEVTRQILQRRPVDAGPGAVGQRRARGRPRGGQGRRDRLPGQVGVPRGAARRRGPHRAGRGRLHARARRAGARRVPPAVDRAADLRAGGAAAHRARDRGAAAGRQGDGATSRSPSGSSSRTAPCRTTSRTPSTSCSCTTASSWSATPSSRASTTSSADSCSLAGCIRCADGHESVGTNPPPPGAADVSRPPTHRRRRRARPRGDRRSRHSGPSSAAQGHRSLAKLLTSDGNTFDKNKHDFDIVTQAVLAVLAAKPNSAGRRPDQGPSAGHRVRADRPGVPRRGVRPDRASGW